MLLGPTIRVVYLSSSSTMDMPQPCRPMLAVNADALFVPPIYGWFLPGLVKVLRRCVRDMAGKCSSVVELCVKAEKEMNQEV